MSERRLDTSCFEDRTYSPLTSEILSFLAFLPPAPFHPTVPRSNFLLSFVLKVFCISTKVAMVFQPSKRDPILHALLFIVFTLTLTFSLLVLLARSNNLRFLSPQISEVQWNACPVPPSSTPYSALYPKVFHSMQSLRPESYSGAADVASDDDIDWEALLLTANGGFLMVEEADGATKGYGVSMFHQLHCLTMIRTMLLGQAMSMEHETQGEEWKKDPRHWVHCLEYLTQVWFFHPVLVYIGERLIQST